MPDVVIPVSGTAIDKADITDMHEAVRGRVNAVPLAALRRDGLGPQHLPSLMVGKASLDNTTSETVTTIPVVFGQTAVGQATWAELTSYQLTGMTLPPCLFVYGCSIRWERWNAAAPNWDVWSQVWLAPYYRKNGVNVYNDDNSRQVTGQYRDIGDADWKEQESTFTIYDAIDFSGEAGNFTLDRIGVRGALNPGGGALVPGTGAVFPHGVIWWKAFYRQT